jgi:hypothetical protein
VIHIDTIAKHPFNNEKSRFEFHHCQGFQPIQRTARTAKNSRRLLRTVPTVPTNSICTGDNTQRSWNLLHQLIKMTNSPEPTEMDLYDQDHFNPSLSDRDLPSLRGRSMEEVQQAFESPTNSQAPIITGPMTSNTTMNPPSPHPSDQEDYQGQEEAMSETSSESSYRQRVPITTLGTDQDYDLEGTKHQQPSIIVAAGINTTSVGPSARNSSIDNTINAGSTTAPTSPVGLSMGMTSTPKLSFQAPTPSTSPKASLQFFTF